MSILEMYQKECKRRSDIFEHLPVLKKYAEECQHITEFGVRGVVSTWAFLSAKPKKMISYDINDCKIEEAEILAKQEGINFKFIKGNTLEIIIEPTDLLFIDTLHTYDQLSKELKLHADKVRKYIVMHDTQTFGAFGEPVFMRKKGLIEAIWVFLKENKNWIKKEELKNNNGLTILEKIS